MQLMFSTPKKSYLHHFYIWFIAEAALKVYTWNYNIIKSLDLFKVFN